MNKKQKKRIHKISIKDIYIIFILQMFMFSLKSFSQDSLAFKLISSSKGNYFEPYGTITIKKIEDGLESMIWGDRLENYLDGNIKVNSDIFQNADTVKILIMEALSYQTELKIVGISELKYIQVYLHGIPDCELRNISKRKRKKR